MSVTMAELKKEETNLIGAFPDKLEPVLSSDASPGSDLVDDLFYQERSALETQYMSAIESLKQQNDFYNELLRAGEKPMSEPDVLSGRNKPRSDIMLVSDNDHLNSPSRNNNYAQVPGLPTTTHQAAFHAPSHKLVASLETQHIAESAQVKYHGSEPESFRRKRKSPSSQNPPMIIIQEGFYFLPNDVFSLPSTNASDLLSEIISRRLTNDQNANLTLGKASDWDDACHEEKQSGHEPARKRVKRSPSRAEDISSRCYVLSEPSSHCHICGRKGKCQLALCANYMLNTCKKVLCTKCVLLFGNETCRPNGPPLDTERFPLHVLSSGACPHCLNTCPARAKCIKYQAINKLRSQNVIFAKRKLASRTTSAQLH